MRQIVLILAAAIYAHALLLDVGIGPSVSVYTFTAPNESSITAGSEEYWSDFSYPLEFKPEVVARLGVNPRDDFKTSRGDFNMFVEYGYSKTRIVYDYHSEYTYGSGYTGSDRHDVDSPISFHDVGIGFGGSLPHAIVNLSIGFELARAYGVLDRGPYGKISLGGYISSSDKTSYKGALIEMDMVLSSHRLGISLVFGIHLNGTKDYTDAEIASKEKEEKVWAMVGVAGMASVGTIGAAASSRGRGGGGGTDYGSDYKTCRYGCLCNDGTISYAEHRQGACSWHGGISVYSK